MERGRRAVCRVIFEAEALRAVVDPKEAPRTGLDTVLCQRSHQKGASGKAFQSRTEHQTRANEHAPSGEMQAKGKRDAKGC